MWTARPVFISSTFLDMQAERDYLRTRVFPELEERLRARRHNLEWVDLRVGVATAAERDANTRELHVLKVCLAEVKRCRPFLIVLLGDRYGWAPPEDRIRAAAAEEGFKTDIAGRSITDLEIDFGVLSDPEQQPRSMFYFRNPLPYRHMPRELAALFSNDYERDPNDSDKPDPGAADRAKRLATLKRRIETQLPTRVRRYTAQWDGKNQCVTGLEEFGGMVLEDIWSELEVETRATAAAADIPWQQVERNALDDFTEDRARDFVGRQEIIARLTSLCLSSTADGALWGICITGDPGSGKSALFGELCRPLKPETEKRATENQSRSSGGARRFYGAEVFLLAHAAGASIQAMSVDSMLRRWIDELAAALGADSHLEENANPDTVDKTFGSLLWQMSSRQRVVVLIDALDQFENTTRARFVTWLPRPWPTNARLIATAIADSASKAMAEHPGMEVLPLPLLDAPEARGIIKGICQRYHRTFEPEVIDALLARTGPAGPAWGNPLWLVLAVEELNLLDAEDFEHARDYEGLRPDQQLRELMLEHIARFPSEITSLYEHTFKRADKLFGANLTGNFLGLIAVGRAGWRESDFLILLPRASGDTWDELKFAQLRRIFRGQMRQRGALAQWDFNHAQMRAAVHARLPARSHPGQHRHTGRDLHSMIADRLLSCRTDDPLHISETMVHLLASEDYVRAAGYYGEPALSEAEELGATRVIADTIIAPASGTSATEARAVCRLLEVPDSFVANIVAQRFLFRLASAIEQKVPLDARFIVSSSTRDAFEHSLDADPKNATHWQEDLAFCYVRLGDVQVPQGDPVGALNSYRSAIAISETLARADPLNVKWQRDLANLTAKVAEVLVVQGEVADALKSYRDSLAITERLAKALPADAALRHDLATSRMKIGEVLLTLGNLQGALKAFRDSDADFDQLGTLNPAFSRLERDRALHYLKIGEVLFTQGNLPEALDLFSNHNAICDRLSSRDPSDTLLRRDLLVSFNKLGLVLLEQNKLVEALKAYQSAFAIAKQLARADPHNANWQRDLSVSHLNIGDVQREQRDLTAALNSYCDALAIAERLSTSDPGNAVWRRHLSVCHMGLGHVQETQHNLSGALNSYREGNAIFNQLAQSDPGNTQWQHDLAASYNRIGYVQHALGDRGGALKSHRDSLTIAEKLARSDPSNPIWQRDLMKSYVNVSDLDALQARALLTRATEVANDLQSKGALATKDAWIPADLARRIATLDR